MQTADRLKKVLIISSRGGYGHTAAANALQAILGDRYQFTIIHPIDQLRIWGAPSGEAFYNFMISNGLIATQNFISRYIAPRLWYNRREKSEQIFNEALETDDFDLVISLIPFLNFPASEAARKKEIPYLMVTTDANLTNWGVGLEDVRHSDLKITIGPDLPVTRDLLIEKGISSAAIETIGLPLHPNFLKKNSKDELKSKYGVPQDKPVVLVMMGGAGGKKAHHYTKEILKMDLGLHLIVCTGKNSKLAARLQELPCHPSNTRHIMGFTDRVHELMAVSDLMVTKPGPGAVNEAIAMRLPLLIDDTDRCLYWEKNNIDLAVSYGIGSPIKKMKDLRKLLENYLHNPILRQSIQRSFAAIPPNLFHERIEGIIQELCSKDFPNDAVAQQSQP